MSAPSKEALRKALGQYEFVLKARVDAGLAKGAADLVQLDEGLWVTLSERLQRSRPEGKGKGKAPDNQECKLSLQELKDIMRWKLAVSELHRAKWLQRDSVVDGWSASQLLI